MPWKTSCLKVVWNVLKEDSLVRGSNQIDVPETRFCGGKWRLPKSESLIGCQWLSSKHVPFTSILKMRSTEGCRGLQRKGTRFKQREDLDKNMDWSHEWPLIFARQRLIHIPHKAKQPQILSLILIKLPVNAWKLPVKYSASLESPSTRWAPPHNLPNELNPQAIVGS